MCDHNPAGSFFTRNGWPDPEDYVPRWWVRFVRPFRRLAWKIRFKWLWIRLFELEASGYHVP